MVLCLVEVSVNMVLFIVTCRIQKRVPVIDRLLRNKKPALCVLNKNASAKTPFKNNFGS